MNWLSNIVAGGAGSLIGEAGKLADRFITTGDEKQQFKLEFERLLHERDGQLEESLRAELGARERVLVAELQQGDAFTKRARPSVVYAGLLFIVFNYCLAPTVQSLAGVPVAPFELPTEFWLGWSGIVGTWSIGRTMEKRGVPNRATQMVTGTPASKLLS